MIFYITLVLNHWLEAHKCPYLQNSIQDRCRNTEAVTKSMLKHGSYYTNPRTHTLKHGAAKSEVAYAKTLSSYMVRGRRCWNTELSLSSDAETQWRLPRCWNTNPDRQQSGRNSRGWNSPWIAMLKQHQQLCKEAVTPAITATPCSALY
jgi:hypothetical protein